jgi:membrane associated rhomboid family serine protease
MFMHASWEHLGGNMLFLWVFGNNVEDSLGSFRYLVFYLAGGAAAAAAQILAGHASTVPMVGASGAIAAVAAGYVVLFPRAPILVLNPVPPLWLFFGLTFMVPAWFVAGEFVVMNVLLGLSAVGQHEGASGGVAVFAHLGGFFAGLFTIRRFLGARARTTPRAWDGWRPPRRRG